MEKRISSTEIRLGVYKDWPFDFISPHKHYYSDSLRIHLLLNQCFYYLQSELKVIIPYNLIKFYIGLKIIHINFGYFQITPINNQFEATIEPEPDEEDLVFTDSDKEFEVLLPLLQKAFRKRIQREAEVPATKVSPKFFLEMRLDLLKRRLRLVVLKNRSVKQFKRKHTRELRLLWSKKLSKLVQQRFLLKAKNTTSVITLNHRKDKSSTLQSSRSIRRVSKINVASLISFVHVLLQQKYVSAILKDMLVQLFARSCYVNLQNFNLLVVERYNYATAKLFQLVREWYYKVGGNDLKFNERLIYLHYAVSYTNLTSLALVQLKSNLEESPYAQKQIMTAFYNLLIAYMAIQRNLFGLRLVFNGAIGQHGRAKTVAFAAGRLNSFLLAMPVEYTAINIDAIFGTIGARWWLGYLDSDTIISSQLQAIVKR